jgi:DNA-binding response OmpR family regulator
MRVLVVEDDSQLAATLRRGLEEAGFSVDLARTGDEGLESASATAFDIVILDLMLTGRDTVSDRILGLDAGADDYLVKPFAFGELLARLRALGRRHLPDRSATLEAGDLRLDTASHTLSVDGTRVELRAKEFAVLQYFMLNPGRLLTRTQVEEHVWNYDFQADSNLVEAYIARIRRKLATAGAADPFVTVRGAGYRFEP